ncbi:MarR family winged helix-turn-helix transcriptional regulator [Desulforamulus aquiferis]|uniref:MarR family transcriptional regulator n=1 Tax=Desulforamulus aquiferis TaxID=1397668 RepID=A0AAW7ZFV4_9FIRM|nr:MarR family transcriptional regulator [Desulforamulus aquiferis]MDO7788214.1 MarR family transcriptional regulator [Desulforamulus aquiferis]
MDESVNNFKNFKVTDTLGHIVNRVAIIMRKKLTARFKEEGVELTPEEFAILFKLWEEDGLFQSEITEKTLKDKTRVTRLLDNLIKKSFVEKKIDKNDRRSYQIFLTDKGIRHKYRVLPIVREIMNQSSNQVSSRDLEITIKTLKKVFENINSVF